MRVGFMDPDGPRLWRMAPYALPLLVLLLAIYGPLPGSVRLFAGATAFILFNLLGIFGSRQRSPRPAELVCGPGYVEVKQSGSRNQRIFAKDVTGATTARTSGGIMLTLQHRSRSKPITIELESEADADRVRHTLGIGHGGFGVIAWRTQSASERRAQAARVLAAAALTMVTATVFVAGNVGFIGLLTLIAFIASLIGFADLFSSPDWPTVVMTAEGLRLLTPRGWFALPYEGVRHLEPHERAFLFDVPQPYTRLVVANDPAWLGGLSPYERKVLVSQVIAASQRARGLGPEKKDVMGRVDVLRRNGESPRDWLVRLDIAGQLLASGSGYRGHTLDTEDLWTVLEDPEADPEIRAAAARVLRHLPAPETRMRIAAAVAAVRDDETNQRLRIAIRDDLDAASRELAYLDASEHAARQLPPMNSASYQGRPIR